MSDDLPGSTFLQGDSVFLKTVEEGDLDFLRDNANDADIRRSMTGNGPVSTSRLRSLVFDDEDYHFVICTTDTPVGYVSLHGISDVDGTGTLSYWICPDHWGNGYATEAIELVVEYAFSQLRLHKVRADVRDFSDASKCVLEKVGFVHEGVLRESRYVDGEHWDRYRFGILEDEWTAVERRERT